MYDRILVPTDGGDAMATVIDHAAELADLAGATVQVLYVLDERAFLTMAEEEREEAKAEMEAKGKAAIEAATERLASAGVDIVSATEQGDPAEEVLSYADREGSDVIVMGTRRGEFGKSMLGSVSEDVIVGADVPVLTLNVADEE